MFGSFDMSSFRGVGMIILQILRVFTIIGLLAAETACAVLIAKVNTGNPYCVFEATSMVFTCGIALFLIVSEIGVFQRFFRKNWPAFSDQHGLGWLGFAIIIVACNILGKLNNSNSSAESLGSMSFWQLTLAAGILNLTFGVLNVIASFVFSDRKNGVNARDVRTHGSLAGDGNEVASLHYPQLYSLHGWTREGSQQIRLHVLEAKQEQHQRDRAGGSQAQHQRPNARSP
uniref:DUF7598 domain-containing protein n=1 Tax=Bionectria ochroleuca TaxID=29856 RepID=A0A8H7KA39_BIOOC